MSDVSTDPGPLVGGVGTEAPLLEVRRLFARYPVRRSVAGALARSPRRFVHAVDGVSFSLRKGEMLALVGESGCGKTTTAQTILRLMDPISGTILLDGREITQLSQRELRPIRRRMQMIYQDPYESLDPRFRVRQAVEEPMLIQGLGGDRSERRQRVAEALARVELTPPEIYVDQLPTRAVGRTAPARGDRCQPGARPRTARGRRARLHARRVRARWGARPARPIAAGGESRRADRLPTTSRRPHISRTASP